MNRKREILFKVFEKEDVRFYDENYIDADRTVYDAIEIAMEEYAEEYYRAEKVEDDLTPIFRGK